MKKYFLILAISSPALISMETQKVFGLTFQKKINVDQVYFDPETNNIIGENLYTNKSDQLVGTIVAKNLKTQQFTISTTAVCDTYLIEINNNRTIIDRLKQKIAVFELKSLK